MYPPQSFLCVLSLFDFLKVLGHMAVNLKEGDHFECTS